MTLKKMLRVFVLSCAALVCAAPTSQQVVPPDSVTSVHPEVRLRKLHLVRPDLIHYPLSVEVIC
jgi:hypothetical protein